MKRFKQQMQHFWRQRRMSVFLTRMEVKSSYRIIDLGGTPELWEMVEQDLDITLLNFPEVIKSYQQLNFRHHYHFLAGDACHLTDLKNSKFDLVFSNSVIEHVGSLQRQEAFAETVHKLAPRYWIQTPSLWFPIEAHCGLPFWWFYPQPIKQAWIHRWQQQGRVFLWQQMSETQVLTRRRLRFLFPKAQIYTEYVVGFPKSYSMYYL
jgi:hypothetical protein